jgi:hypothetical protein
MVRQMYVMARTSDCYQNFGKRPPIIAIFRFEMVSAKTFPLDIVYPWLSAYVF